MWIDKKSNFRTVLFILIVVAFFIRVAGSNQFFESDEGVWAQAVKSGNYMEIKIPNSLLSLWVIWPFVSVFGVHTWSIRMPFILAGMFTILYTYLTSKMLFGEKSAFWSVLITSFSAWHVLASLQVIYEGSFLTLFFLMAIYYYTKYERDQKKQDLILTGIAFGLAILSKLPAILFIPTIWISGVINSRKMIDVTKKVFSITVVGLLVFSIFLIVSIITKSPAFVVSIYYFFFFPTLLTTTITSLPLLSVQFLYAILWAGPLMISALPLFIVFGKSRDKKKSVLLIVWIVFTVLFYTFVVQDNFRPMERYLMIIIPPLAILIGEVFATLRLNNRHKIMLVSIFVICLGSYFLMSYLPGRFLPFYPKTEYIKEAVRLNWDFYVPFTGSSGPVGFYVKFAVIASAFTASGIAFLLALLMRKKKNIVKIMLVFLLGISLAYNIFVIQEYLVGITGPNINKVSWEMIEYINEHGLQKPVHLFRNKAWLFYLNEQYLDRHANDFEFDYFDLSSYYIDNFYPKWNEYMNNYFVYDSLMFVNFETQLNQTLYRRLDYFNITEEDYIGLNGTVVFVDFPYTGSDFYLWNELDGCELRQVFMDKGITVGNIYLCD